jgi:hypothetical protein
VSNEATVIELSTALNREPRRVDPIPAGVHPRMPSGRYHQRELGVVSKSALDKIDRSPLHYRAWVDGELPDNDTPALLFGRAFHASLLEPEVFAKEFVEQPDFGDMRSSANRADRDAWAKEHPGATVITTETMRLLRNMSASVRKHPLGRQLLKEGEPELTVVWNDDETGLKCKCRADYYVPRHELVVDAKSALDASPEQFRRDIAKYRYHVQDALYRAGFSAADKPVQHFVFLAVEKSPPFAVAIYELDSDAIGRGYTSARRNIDTLADCLRKDKWPGYSESIQSLELPPWA